MARASALGVCCALAALVALGAAATTVGITGSWAANHLPSASDMPWWMIVLLATGSVACICGVAAFFAELCSPGSGMGVSACVMGLGVHIGMLVSYTVYLCKYFTLQGYCYMTGCAAATSYGGLPYYFYGSASFNSDHLNAFDYWSEAWTTDMKVLYIFGCAIGVFFWLIALPCAFGDAAVSRRRKANEAEATAAVMNVDALVAPPGQQAPPVKQDQFYTAV